MDKNSPENYHVKSKTKVLITSMKTTLHVNHCNISSSGVIGLWLWGGKLGGAQCGVYQVCKDKGKVDGGSFNKEQFQATGGSRSFEFERASKYFLTSIAYIYNK